MEDATPLAITIKTIHSTGTSSLVCFRENTKKIDSYFSGKIAYKLFVEDDFVFPHV